MADFEIVPHPNIETETEAVVPVSEAPAPDNVNSDSDSDAESDLDNEITEEAGSFGDDFTITKWRNKASTDQRARAKEKKKNYQFKAPEDVEWTRAAVQKAVPKEILESLGPLLAVGSEAVLFNAVAVTDGHIYGQHRRIRSTYKKSVPAVLKIWNKPCKSFLESRRPYFENDSDFLELVNQSSVSEFQNIWATKEHDNFVRIASVGIPCPQIIYFSKNIIILSLDPPNIQSPKPQKTLAEAVLGFKNSIEQLQMSFEKSAQLISDLFEKCGLVHADLNASNILQDGSVIDVAQAMNKTLPKALDFLFNDCKNICEFYKSHGLELEACEPNQLFEKITGFEYQGESVSKQETFANDTESRKLERKSHRAAASIKREAP